MKRIKLSHKKYKKYALVDDKDYERVNKYRWTLQVDEDAPITCRFYSSRIFNLSLSGKVVKKHILMHRFILGLEDAKEIVDHINHNGLDNRRVNLRTCTRNQNNMNRNMSRKNKSGYKGLHKNVYKSGTYYAATIKHNGKYIYLGCSKDPKKVALLYNDMAKKLFGEFAKLNKI